MVGNDPTRHYALADRRAGARVDGVEGIRGRVALCLDPPSYGKEATWMPAAVKRNS